MEAERPKFILLSCMYSTLLRNLTASTLLILLCQIRTEAGEERARLQVDRFSQTRVCCEQESKAVLQLRTEE